MHSLRNILGFVALASLTTLAACDQSKPALDKATADLAAKHDLKGFADQGSLLFRQMNNAPLKNTGGVLAANLMLPSYQKVMEHFWTVEDNRVKLLAELMQ